MKRYKMASLSESPFLGFTSEHAVAFQSLRDRAGRPGRHTPAVRATRKATRVEKSPENRREKPVSRINRILVSDEFFNRPDEFAVDATKKSRRQIFQLTEQISDRRGDRNTGRSFGQIKYLFVLTRI